MLDLEAIEKLYDQAVRLMVSPKRIKQEETDVEARDVGELIKAADYLDGMRLRMKESGRSAHGQ